RGGGAGANPSAGGKLGAARSRRRADGLVAGRGDRADRRVSRRLSAIERFARRKWRPTLPSQGIARGGEAKPNGTREGGPWASGDITHRAEGEGEKRSTATGPVFGPCGPRHQPTLTSRSRRAA